jgi:hypothetical protein
MTEWKQIYETITIGREEKEPTEGLKTNSLLERIIAQQEDAKLISYLNMVVGLDPSPKNKLRLELFKDFLKLLRKDSVSKTT